MIFNFLKSKGIDSAVIYVILQRGWSSIAGLITLFLLVKFLSKVELGFYYAFSSLIGIQMIFELGLTTVIRQFISHDMAHLTMTKEGYIKGEQKLRIKLLKLVMKSLKAYTLICFCIVIVITPIGLLFFYESGSSESINWEMPWVMLVFFSALNCFISVVTAILEGLGFISRVKKVLLISTVFSSVAVWIVLFAGYGLYAPLILNACNFVCVAFWGWKCFGKIFIQAYRVNARPDYMIYQTKWKTDIWPIQWRVAISWLGGYFVFYIVNPIAFKYYGPEFSGQLGLSFQVINLMLAMSASLIATKMPHFGQLISIKDYETLNKTYRMIEFSSSIFFIVMSFGLILFLMFFKVYGISYVDRLLPIGLLFILLVMTFLRNLINCHACYVRSFKQEKHSISSIMTGLLTVVVLLFSANYLTGYFYVISYACIVILFAYPHSLFIYLRFRRNNES